MKHIIIIGALVMMGASGKQASSAPEYDRDTGISESILSKLSSGQRYKEVLERGDDCNRFLIIAVFQAVQFYQGFSEMDYVEVAFNAYQIGKTLYNGYRCYFDKAIVNGKFFARNFARTQ